MGGCGVGSAMNNFVQHVRNGSSKIWTRWTTEEFPNGNVMLEGPKEIRQSYRKPDGDEEFLECQTTNNHKIFYGQCDSCRKLMTVEQDVPNSSRWKDTRTGDTFHPHSKSPPSSYEWIRSNSSEIRVRCLDSYSYNRTGTYKNRSLPRGLVFMMNFREFLDPNTTREGSEIDFANLIQLFTQMGYKCDEENEFCLSGSITSKRFRSKLKEFRNLEQHKEVDSCIVVIMSHGSSPNKFITSDGDNISIRTIYRALDNGKCPNLSNKPKIIIYEYCRLTTSDSEDNNIEENRNSSNTNSSLQEYLSPNQSSDTFETSSRQRRSFMSSSSSIFTDSGYVESSFKGDSDFKIDANASNYVVARDNSVRDFYCIFPSINGEAAYRDTQKGTLLMRAICHVFARHAYDHHILGLFKQVSQYMLEVLQPDDITDVNIKQVCERTSIGFDKNFYFNPINLP